MKITDRIRDYLQLGIGMGMGTRDADLKPEYQRVLGCRVVDNNHITFYFDLPTSRNTIRNLETNSELVIVGCSNTFESYQLKGKAIRWAKATPEEISNRDEYMVRFSTDMMVFGLPGNIVYNYPHSEMMSVLMEVADIFEQTPKAGTGEKI
jgi:hypothetical protein